MDAQPGDTVTIKTAEETIIGILLPRAANLPQGYQVIKLENGYNIGIDTQRITSMTVIKKREPHTQTRKAHTMRPGLPTVALLTAGGTIASKVDYTTGGVHAGYNGDDFLEILPELSKIANLKTRSVMNIMSEDMTPEHWKALAREVHKELCDPTIKGIVISHGTDTMHFTSAALAFMLGTLTKPVIITGAQRSIDRGSSDAFLNFLCSISAAARWDGAEVAICMHASTNDTACNLIRGTKARKMHTSRRDAFQPINDDILATIDDKGTVKPRSDSYRKRSTHAPEDIKATFEEMTGLLQVYPGMHPSIIEHCVKTGFKGIVLSATALGHVNTTGQYSLLGAIETAHKKGIIIAIATQTLYGRTHPYVYANLRKLSIERGCVFASDMTPETAYIKLGWLIGQNLGKEKTQELFLQNLQGEINTRHHFSQFQA